MTSFIIVIAFVLGVVTGWVLRKIFRNVKDVTIKVKSTDKKDD